MDLISTDTLLDILAVLIVYATIVGTLMLGLRSAARNHDSQEER